MGSQQLRCASPPGLPVVLLVSLRNSSGDTVPHAQRLQMQILTCHPDLWTQTLWVGGDE